jgi:hypothetical protein
MGIHSKSGKRAVNYVRAPGHFALQLHSMVLAP